MDKTALKDIKLFILDMDGTIYLGNRPFAFTRTFFEYISSHGKDYLLFTNNASKSTADYVTKLKKMDLNVPAEKILTSGDVTAEFLNTNRPGSSVFLAGTRSLEESFKKAGIKLVSSDPSIVVTSFDTTLTYEKLEKACRFIRTGAEFISTHCDLNCPTENGFIPDSGSICAAITASTGIMPRYFGKPYPETIEMIEKITGYARSKMAIAGDRLYTDIKMGVDAGISSILVLSGETKRSDLKNSTVQPDYVFDDLGCLLDHLKHSS